MSSQWNETALGFATRAVHVGNEVDKDSGAVKRPITMANSYALPSARAFLLWLRENYSPWDALSLGLVPAGAADCKPDLALSQLLMEVYENRRPLVYAPLGSYMEQRQEMEDQLGRALDLLY